LLADAQLAAWRFLQRNWEPIAPSLTISAAFPSWPSSKGRAAG
jgi:hypothetical protein